MANHEVTSEPIDGAMRAGVEHLREVLGATVGKPVGIVVLCVIYDASRKDDLRIAGTYTLGDAAKVMESGAKAARKTIRAASKRPSGTRMQ